MAEEDFTIKMVVYMMENGKKIKCMVKECYIMPLELLHMMGIYFKIKSKSKILIITLIFNS